MLALHRLGHTVQAIDLGSKANSPACALVPAKYSGFIPYDEEKNRSSHVLAYDLASLHQANNDRAAALAICDRMLTWWPGVNLGFRFLGKPA